MKTPKKSIVLILFLMINIIKNATCQTPPVYLVNTPSDLLNYVGYVCHDPSLPALQQNTIVPAPVFPAGTIIRVLVDVNLDVLISGVVCSGTGIATLPLIIPSGVILEGNYDLLSLNYTSNPNHTTISTSPLGTKFFSKHRSQYDGTISPPNLNTRSTMYYLTMEPGKYDALGNFYPTTVRHIRLEGPSQNWTEFNIGFGTNNDQLFCGGIQIWRPCKFFTDANNQVTGCNPSAFNFHTGEGYLISNCEFSGFSFASIFLEKGTDALTIQNCYIHHTKGINNEQGIGYGIWYQGETFNYLNSLASWDIKVYNNIFDEVKDALDGYSAYSPTTINQPYDIFPVNLEVRKNTVTKFGGGFNRHNNDQDYKHDPTINIGCYFWERGYPVEDSKCLATDVSTGFTIKTDVTQGNSLYNENIFYDKAGISSPFPGVGNLASSTPTDYFLFVENNTFAQNYTPQDGNNCNEGVAPYGQNLKNGYATIADNYIESCCWYNEVTSTHLRYNNNSFSYKPNANLQNVSPQPPEAHIDLTDATGVALPFTNTPSVSANHPYVQQVSNSVPFKIKINPGNLGSTSPVYIIRTNPSSNAVITGSSNASSNNYYYNGQEITPSTTGTFISQNKQYSGPTNSASEFGLYGIDVLAVASNGATTSSSGSWSMMNASDWQHIPLIVTSPLTADYKKLVFNIKDSYQEFHNALTAFPNGLTGVYKQVELNGTIIWQEDIAIGGDGWERIVVDLTGIVPGTATTSILSLFNVKGKKNTLTFSIGIPTTTGSVPNNKLKGLLVWVDDVYLKKNNSWDNLIQNGSLEATPDLSKSGWYPLNRLAMSCGPNIPIAENGYFYPDGSRLNSILPTTIATQTTISNRDHKSGQYAIQLMIPELINCSDWIQQIPSSRILISAATDIDFTDFFTCADYKAPPFGWQNLTSITGATTANAGYFLDNPMLINSDLTFTNNSVAFASNSSLTVNNGITLNIDKTNQSTNLGEHSVFFGCADMWDGIISNQGIIDLEGHPNSYNEIKDAKTALKAVNGGTIKIIRTTFDENNISIQLGGNFATTSYINSCNFLCSSTNLTKSPFQNATAEHHIKLTNVTLNGNLAFPIGYFGSDNGAYDCYFDNATNGIFSENSFFNVYMSHFSNSFDKLKTNGILSVGIPGMTSPNKVSVIPNMHNDYNSFTNLYCGIYTTGVNELTVQGENIFEKCKLGIRSLDVKDIQVGNNIFNNFETAIGVYDGQSSTDLKYNKIYNNKFNMDLSYANLELKGFDAIDVQNTIPVRRAFVIENNEIKNCVTGIHLRQCPSVDAFNNYILDEAPSWSHHAHRGIWMENCQDATIRYNNISWSAGIANADLIHGQQGIATSNSAGCDIRGNYVHNISAGLNFLGDCRNSNMHCNIMQECFNGVYLQDFSTVVTEQGTADVSWNNWWADNRGAFKVDGDGVLSAFNWYYLVSGGYDDPQPCNTGFVSGLLANSILECPIIVHGGDEERESAFGDVVRDTIIDDPDSISFKMAAEEAFYKVMKTEPALLMLNVPADDLYQDKYNELEQSNVGKYDEVKELLAIDDKSTALQRLASIVDQNLLEQNKKYVASLIANDFHPEMDADSDTVNIVINIAYMHPFYGGEAVYWSRALLHLDVEDVLPQLRRSLQPSIGSNVTTMHGKLYPVPASTNATFVYQHDVKNLVELQVCNTIGQLLNNYRLIENDINFSVAHLLPGMYYLKLLVDNEIKEKHKLIIVK